MKDDDPYLAVPGDVGECGLIEIGKRRLGGAVRRTEPGLSYMGLRLLFSRYGAVRMVGRSGSAQAIPVGMATCGAGGIRSRQGAGSPAMPCKTVRGGT